MTMLAEPTRATVLPESLLCIDGEMRQAEGGRTYENIGPWTGDVVGVAADASAADVEAAIAAARRAFDTTDWSTNHEKRFALVKKLHALFVANQERLADIARHEVGAPLVAVNRAQVANCLGSWKDLMEVYPRLQWEKDYGTKETMGFTTHRKAVYEAVGVVGAITPWNFPLYVNAEKVVSALLAGCTVILKPAPDTPLAGAIFGELAIEAGFPAGVLNVITGSDPAMAGEMLVTDPRVDLITFTGSTAIGKHIMKQGADTMKRVFLELGGKSANIVLEDEPNFARIVAQSILVFHAGQGCAVQSRLLVPRSRYEEAKAVLKAAYDGFADKWGHFDDPACSMGPVVSKKQMERVKAYIDLGIQEGATLLAGGELRPDKGTGWFVEPTCFVDVTNDMRIAQEEIFGPVLVVIPFEDDEDAIRIANDSIYGLSGGVWSGDLDRAMAVAKRIRTGTIGVNGGAPINGDLPFGGYKHSGIGRAWGIEGIEEYLETKVIGWRE
ncbi:aldehyde dehydrogenase family protein [Novosphingobium album (ex Liu et al. 2023)]|uniref:Aldehyde dehydrogenase family protein n=1 Tax=Novosphingobium album (ex Liu et al. 2023) TaxID=3031130 RepID=A0ABT5WVU7_9SPHN|nr:aldehyde dehydrogenase family protein [Novosphingobium album (ex Liu et al. 2023)]MDE8654004.1 aldehyde dehydrogenase family protein [Novosphingobium album (ex Liu et al. 2023)]